jgi:ribosomal protein S12 methylthiotransferase
MENMKKTVNIFTLGCSKNRVDSEVTMKQLSENGYSVVHESAKEKADFVLINTCGFIGDAKEESIETILNFVKAKENGMVKKVLVFGCLSERYKDELMKEIPEVDAWFGKFELPKMLKYMTASHFPTLMPNRIITTPSHYAFLKISEGCNRGCSFCAIPNITGSHISRTMESLVEEATSLVANGVKELILIAQELSYYGIDLYKKQMLAPLMEQLAQIPGLAWLRIHYTYPARFPMDILPVMAKYPNICKYMDIALQHISHPMLSAMRRNVTKEETFTLIRAFREQVPGINLRTTLMVGHPGETEQDFQELVQFVKDIRFERLGVFTYSHEENTYAWNNYKDEVPDEIKQRRADEIMEIQQHISLELNQLKIGKTFKVLIDRREGEYYIGRTEFDSPEVDNEVLITTSKRLAIGTFKEVMVTEADEYDLYAKLV